MSRLRRRIGLAVPVGVVVVTGAVLAGTMLASAAAPKLPHRTAAQLLARMRTATLPAAMTAVLSESANLGLPALPDVAMSSSATSATSLLAGSHTVDIWYAGPRHLRVAIPVPFGETDLRVNGSQVWLWDSHGQTATHLELPALPARSTPKPGRSAVPVAPLTPIQWADRVLAMVGPTTKVTVAGTVSVAGRSAYQLAIAPRAKQSLVDRVLIAVDAKTYLPLQVQVFARGMSGPAFQIGFTSLSFGRPAMSNFTFTPPSGAHVKVVKLPSSLPGQFPGPICGAGMFGEPGVPKPAAAGSPGQHPRSLPCGMPSGAVKPATFGSGWLTVVAIQAGQALGPAGQGGPRVPAGGSFEPNGPVKPAAGPAGQLPGLIGLLMKAATKVHGSWGSGRLLRTSLLSVLVTSKGQVLAGAVTPAVLYADAAKAK